MKIRSSVHLFCSKCYLIKRYKSIYIFCIKKKHKQKQKIKKK